MGSEFRFLATAFYPGEGKQKHPVRILVTSEWSPEPVWTFLSHGKFSCPCWKYEFHTYS
jgi:hypothetical protein